MRFSYGFVTTLVVILSSVLSAAVAQQEKEDANNQGPKVEKAASSDEQESLPSSSKAGLKIFDRETPASEGTEASEPATAPPMDDGQSWLENWSKLWNEWRQAIPTQGLNFRNAEERSLFASREFIRQHDKNNDKVLSKEEMPESMRNAFEHLDTDHDGSLTRTEIQRHAWRARRPSASPVESIYVWIMQTDAGRLKPESLQEAYDQLRRLDKDGDGEISSSEIASRRDHIASLWCDQCFDRHDDDRDGQLSQEEAKGSEFEDDFAQFDHNKDGYLTKSEVHRAVEERLAKRETGRGGIQRRRR